MCGLASSQGSKRRLRVQYFADLHLELSATKIPTVPAKGDVLVLAGDMGDLDSPKLRTFMEIVSHSFPHTLVISGNREYYQWSKSSPLTMSAIDSKLSEFYSRYPNVHYLNKSTWIHPESGVAFHGCTLWAYVPPELASVTERRVFSYRYAYSAAGRRVRVVDTNALHEDHVRWIKEAVKQTRGGCVVITHHAPTFRFWGYKKGDEIDPKLLAKALGNDLDEFIEASPQIKLWICGHVHWVEERMVGETLCSMNCIGYPGKLFPLIVHFDKVFDIPY